MSPGPKPELSDEQGLRLLKEMAIDLAEVIHKELHGDSQMGGRFTPAGFEKLRTSLASRVHRMSEITGKPAIGLDARSSFAFYRRVAEEGTEDNWRLDAEIDSGGRVGSVVGPNFEAALHSYMESKDRGSNPPLHGDILAVIHSPAPGNPDLSQIMLFKITRPPEGGFSTEKLPMEQASIMPPLHVRLTHDEGAYDSDDQRIIGADKVFSRFGYELKIQTNDDGEIVRFSAQGAPADPREYNDAHAIKPQATPP